MSNGADQNVGEDLRSPVTGRLDITDIFILLIISSNNITGLDFKHSKTEAAQRIFFGPMTCYVFTYVSFLTRPDEWRRIF